VVFVALAIACAVCAGPQPLKPVPTKNGQLPQIKINSSYLTGISSGAYMANQLHVAYATHFSGAALFAGGPYFCAQGNVDTGLYTCAESFPINSIDLPLLEQLTGNWSGVENDPISALASQPVWVHHGLVDFIVWGRVTDALVAYYNNYGAKVTYHNTTISNHAWISPYGPTECDLFESPYIANCGYDAEALFLQTLLGSVNAPNDNALTGTLYSFSQDYYVNQTWGPTYSKAASIYMDTTGYLYVPQACASGQQCRLFAVLHGCQQYFGAIGLDMVTFSNMNEYADTNNFVVFYPQTIASSFVGPNPEGCWDWWGYVGPTKTQYVQRNGFQMKVLFDMMQAIGTK